MNELMQFTHAIVVKPPCAQFVKPVKAVTHLPYQLLQDRQETVFLFSNLNSMEEMNEISFRFIALTWPHRP